MEHSDLLVPANMHRVVTAGVVVNQLVKPTATESLVCGVCVCVCACVFMCVRAFLLVYLRVCVLACVSVCASVPACLGMRLRVLLDVFA